MRCVQTLVILLAVPDDFHNVLMQYTKQGYRVIALAWRPLAKLSYVKVHRAQREQVECSLEFLGLLIMENRLKPETTPTIGELREANIRTIMITGRGITGFENKILSIFKYILSNHPSSSQNSQIIISFSQRVEVMKKI